MIAAGLGLNIEGMALKIISAPSPFNKRQTVRKVNAPSSLGSMSQAASFNLKMMQNPLAAGSSKHSHKSQHELSRSGENNTTKVRLEGFDSVRNVLANKVENKTSKVRMER